MYKKIISIVFLLVVIYCQSPANAEVYKWVDEHGQTHYSERPPDGSATEIKIKEPQNVDKALEKNMEERDKMLKIYEEERNLKKEEKLKAEAEAEKMKRKCMEVKNDLADMQQAGIVYYVLDEKGERIYLSEEEMTKRRAKLQAQYNEYCK